MNYPRKIVVLERNLTQPSTPTTGFLERLRNDIQRGLAISHEELVRVGTALGQVNVSIKFHHMTRLPP